MRAARVWVRIGQLAFLGVTVGCVYLWLTDQIRLWAAIVAWVGAFTPYGFMIGLVAVVASLVNGEGIWISIAYLVLVAFSSYGWAIGRDLATALQTRVDPDTGEPFTLPSHPSTEPGGNGVAVTLSKVKLHYNVYSANRHTGEPTERSFGEELRILHFLKGSPSPPSGASSYLVPSSAAYFDGSALISRTMREQGIIAVAASSHAIDGATIVLEPLDGALHAVPARDRGKAAPLASPRNLKELAGWKSEAGARIDAEEQVLANQLVSAMTIET